MVVRERSVRSEIFPWHLVGAAGLTFALIGWTDVLLLWYPLRIGRPDWEFATVSGSFDALPLATIGTVLIVAWLHAGAERLTRRIVAGLLVVTVLAMCGALVLFGLSFATGFGTVEAETRWILVRAGAKTSIAAVAYIVLYIVMVRSLMRASRKDRAV
jgi:hypothetical protein